MTGNFTHLFTLLFCIIFVSPAYCQENTYRSLDAWRVNEAPKIDGIPDENVWKQNPKVQKANFIQFEPDNGKPSSYSTEVNVIYDDAAIYVAIRLYDPDPENIPRELGMRDDLGRNADQVYIAFDTYGNGQTAHSFGVTSAGVQFDFIMHPDGEDLNRDAIWKSAVGFEENAWVVEMEIPYMALRFPKEEVQGWKINIMRSISRKQERSFWSYIDNSVDGMVNQFAPLHGLRDIKPPLRLSLSPFITSYFTYDQASESSRTRLTGGLDLKYGISESFTLDMSLVPDFGQVQSDNVVLNLTPFEVRFDENRPFFTEGTEIFDKGGLFYSRRVGQSFGVFQPQLAENEVLTHYPHDAPLLNAVKISGRTRNGLGVGIFNSVTNRTFAKVKNRETGKERRVLTDPLTNFNVIVLDQNLKNNSNISFINTNVNRADDGRDSNVSGLDFRLQDSKNTYRISGFGAISHLYDGREVDDTGYKYYLSLEKISGTYRYEAGRNVESHDYDPNDLGFLQASNKTENFVEGSYNFFKPRWKFNNFRYRIRLTHKQLYRPRQFVTLVISNEVSAQLRNFWSFTLGLESTPSGYNDYFEARVKDQVFSKPPEHELYAYLNSDSRKRLSFSANINLFRVKKWNAYAQTFGLSPRFRINNRLSFIHDFSFSGMNGYQGFATHINQKGQLQNIVMGIRDVKTVSNTFTTRYIINNKMGFSIRLRHYWSKVNYNGFFSLGEDGHPEELNYSGTNEAGTSLHNENFNSLNLDLVYQWQIAPGSFINIVWKDTSFRNFSLAEGAYLYHLKDVFSYDHHYSVSAKLIWFIDYLKVKNRINSIH